MISPDVLCLVPSPSDSFESQTRESLRDLEERLRATGRDHDRVLALTFFVDAADRDSYRECHGLILNRIGEAFDGAPPAASVVAQAPEGRCHVALEAAVLSPRDATARIERKTHEGHAYSLVENRDTTVLFGAGIGSDLELDDPAARARDAFAIMEGILHRERLTFGHVIRQWNYLEDMLDLRRDGGRSRQGYQALNDVRSLHYDRTEFPAGYPAATGIGQAAGGVILEFIALDAPTGVRVAAVSNPKQVDAHRYSDGVLVGESLEDVSSKTAPKFERAKQVIRGDEEVVFVSGTASILGETTVAVGDVAGQTRTTIDNIAALVANRPLSRLRAYVKRTEDIPVVREVCESAYGSIPALYVTADVCRDELLVELEGSLVVSGDRRGDD